MIAIFVLQCFAIQILDNYAYENGASVPPVMFNRNADQVQLGQPSRPAEAMEKVKSFVADHFPGAAIVDERSVSIFFLQFLFLTSNT